MGSGQCYAINVMPLLQAAVNVMPLLWTWGFYYGQQSK